MKTNYSFGWGLRGQQLILRQIFRGGALLCSIAALAFSSATMRAAPPWSAPETLSYPAVNANSPRVAGNENGRMVAAWVRQEDSRYEVQASMYRKNVWSAPENLSLSGDSAFDVSVAMDSNGVATAVWTVNYQIQTSTNRPSSRREGWSSPIGLSAVGLSAANPHVVADAAGNTTAMWTRYDENGVPGIETAFRPAGGNWGSPQLLAAGAPRELMLVVNANGDTAAVWNIGAFTSNTSIYVATRPAPTPWGTVGVWSQPYNLAPLAYRQGGAKIGITAKGDVTACWRTNTEIRIADKTAGGNWGAVTTVYANHAISDYPTLAVTASGDVMAAWITYVYVGGTSYNYQIGTAVRPTGGIWGTPAFLTDNTEYDMELHAGTSNSGACVLTWRDVNGGDAIKSATWSIKKGWYDFATIAEGSDLNLAVAGNTAVAIWMGGVAQAQVSTAPIE
jgi:hypothetical protein